MTLKPQVLILIGASVLSLAGAIAVQAATESSQPSQTIAHTVRGNMTAFGPETQAVRCSDIKVDAIVKSLLPDPTGTRPDEQLGSTTAQGNTLGEGCTYSLMFNYSPSRQLPPLSRYQISAATPVLIDQPGQFSAGYVEVITSPFPEQVDMKF